MVVSKEEIVSFVKQNLGKVVRVDVDDIYKSGIIVGYNDEFVIVSFADHSGWEENELEPMM